MLVIAGTLVAVLVNGRGPRQATRLAIQPAPQSAVTRAGIAVGLTEFNPNLYWSQAARPMLPPGVATLRDRLLELRPKWVRLVVEWNKVQPDAARAPDWSVRDAGCNGTTPPCVAFGGMREDLAALRSAQLASPGNFNVVVVLLGMPRWAGRAVAGCDAPPADPSARPIDPAALPAYRRLVADLAALGRREGIALDWWSPWNEPNHPGTLSPQRSTCAVDSPTLAASEYAPLARAMRSQLAAEPGDQHIVLGELAGYVDPRPTATSAVEFLDALPDDVVCSADVWAQHAYVGNVAGGASAAIGGDATPEANAKLLADMEGALDARACPRTLPLWITETGVGGARPGGPRPTGEAQLRSQCVAMDTALRRWDADPRIAAAFQYTFREDDGFAVGLSNVGLTRLYEPLYTLWRAWSNRAGAGPPSGHSC